MGCRPVYEYGHTPALERGGMKIKPVGKCGDEGSFMALGRGLASANCKNVMLTPFPSFMNSGEVLNFFLSLQLPLIGKQRQ